MHGTNNQTMLTFHVIASALLLTVTQPAAANIIANYNSQHNTTGNKGNITHARTADALGSFVFMGEHFPDITPEQFMLQTNSKEQKRDMFLFMEDWYPKMPMEQLSISHKADRSFMFMDEQYHSLPTEEAMLPINSK